MSFRSAKKFYNFTILKQYLLYRPSYIANFVYKVPNQLVGGTYNKEEWLSVKF